MTEHSAIALIIGLVPICGWLLIRRWYFGLVSHLQSQVRHQDGRLVPGQPPKLLVGNLSEVYKADNRLAAYHYFHRQFGDVVQIFWLWRQQISVASSTIARHILVTHQKNYRKFPPNRLIQRLYGSSVLTNHDQEWQRQRSLMQSVFLPHRVAGFHSIFVDCSEQLVAQWLERLDHSTHSLKCDVYPDLLALFLDIIGRAALGIDFGALQGHASQLLTSIRYILQQSTHPLHQFTAWWQFVPLPANRRLADAFATVDQFLYELIRQRRAEIQQGEQCSDDLMSLLLRTTEWVEGDLPALTDQEVRDNLLAIIVNGYETVATSAAFSLDLLARHPEHLAQVQTEIEQVFTQGAFSSKHLVQLPYLKATIVESLRLCPPMAGLQRISIQPDSLAGWSIPAEQAVGISLVLLHQDADIYGEQPEQFCPQRYLEQPQTVSNERRGSCPMRIFLGKNSSSSTDMPLTFGNGARRCLGETFALHEMTVALAILLHHFNVQVQPGEEAEMELGKFSLFISMLPKRGVTLTLRQREQQSAIATTSERAVASCQC
jgi:cytochrome P450